MALVITRDGAPLAGQVLGAGPVDLTLSTSYRVTELAVTIDGQPVPASWSTAADGALWSTTVTADLAGAPAGGAELSVQVVTRGATTQTAPVTVAPAQPPLSWAPTELTDPETIVVTDANRSLTLDRARDYIVQLPGSLGHPQRAPLQARGGLVVVGGRNVRIIGGAIRHDIDYAAGTTAARGVINRALHLTGWTGDMHLEGITIGGDWLFEGINVVTGQPDAQLIVQNVLIEDVILALVGGGHEGGDALHNYAGPAGGYYIDKFSVLATSYQGLFCQPTKLDPSHAPRRNVLRRFSINHWSPDERAARPLPDAPYDPPRGWGSGGVQLAAGPGPWELQDVWINPAPKFASPRQGMWPSGTVLTAADGTREIATATSRPDIAGSARIGLPPDGHWVKPGEVGIDYVSPGYLGPAPARA